MNSFTIAIQKLIEGLSDGDAWNDTPLALLEKLYEFESSIILLIVSAALISKIRGQESSLNDNGIYFKVGRDSEHYVMALVRLYNF